MRDIKYSQAISEALVQSMANDPTIFIYGVGAADPTGIFGTTREAALKFGPSRVMDMPMSENTLTGIGVGAAMSGLRPVLVHARNDFLLLTMDQIVNHAAKWRYMSGGQFSVPLLIRAIIGRGWGQAAQHSQSLQALFAHIPGLQVIMPATPYDAKGLLISSLKSDRTTICLEHRWLYDKTGSVPEEIYEVPFGKGAIVRTGKDITLVAISHMLLEAKIAADMLAKENIDVEIIDPRSLRPLDEPLILESLKKTGRLVVADTGWTTCGLTAEIAAIAVEKGFHDLKAPVIRIGLPDTPTPCSSVLEAAYYPTANTIYQSIHNLVRPTTQSIASTEPTISKKEFSGPF